MCSVCFVCNVMTLNESGRLVVGGCQVMPVGVCRSPYEKGASITLVLSKESHVRKVITG